MACVTLKRPHHALSEHPFEPATPPPGLSHAHHHTQHRPPPSKRRRCVPLREHSRDRYEAALLRRQNLSHTSTSSSPLAAASLSTSAFSETPLTPAEIANNLRDELKRLKRRRQIPAERTTPPSSPEPMMDDAAAIRTASMAIASTSSAASTSIPVRPGSPGKAIFTLKQMTMICERMCKERTDQVRSEYEKILQQKLGEQYDAFVKFIDHQIQQRFNQSQPPSYLS